jgi:beta-glucuronidase
MLPVYSQESISLNGKWQFWIPEKMKPQLVTVPHTYNIMDGLEDYAGEAWYSRELPVSQNLKGKQLRIYFNAVYHDATVYVNDSLVGEHLNAGYTPFNMDITRFIKYNGERNTLKIKCSNSFSEDNLPWKRKFDWANDGGIYRSVSLHTSGKYSLRYVHVTPEINLRDSTSKADFKIKLFENNIPGATFELKVRENCTGRIVYNGRQKLNSTDDGSFHWNIDCGKVLLWHFDDPNLYTFEVKVIDGKQVSDIKSERFGFRVFRIEEDHLTLNGEPVRLPGIENMPGSNPEFGMAESHDHMEKTVHLMKDLNCTLTRFHWAQDDYRLQLMDSLGILAQEEISWWQGPDKKLTPSLREAAKRQLDELIEAHYNHPSIWGWGMSNEVSGNQEDLKIMADQTRKLDKTRIVNALCNHIWRDLDKDPSLSLDLPTWNEYTGTWHAKHRDQLPGFFEMIEPVLKGRPLLITESGLCEPVFTGGDARRVDEMIYHINEWKSHKYVCGYIYFCLEDYRTQMGEEGFGKNRIRRHGVCDKTLNPKASFTILQQIMSPLEVTKVKPAGKNENVGTLANIYEIDSNISDAEITVRVKQDIPSYCLRNYKVQFLDKSGNTQSISLPYIQPGQDVTLILKEVNPGFNFKIIRKDGSVALSY